MKAVLFPGQFDGSQYGNPSHIVRGPAAGLSPPSAANSNGQVIVNHVPLDQPTLPSPNDGRPSLSQVATGKQLLHV